MIVASKSQAKSKLHHAEQELKSQQAKKKQRANQ